MPETLMPETLTAPTTYGTLLEDCLAQLEKDGRTLMVDRGSVAEGMDMSLETPIVPGEIESVREKIFQNRQSNSRRV